MDLMTKIQRAMAVGLRRTFVTGAVGAFAMSGTYAGMRRMKETKAFVEASILEMVEDSSSKREQLVYLRILKIFHGSYYVGQDVRAWFDEDDLKSVMSEFRRTMSTTSARIV